MTLPFKAIAVDMDGTFLDDNHEFDAKQFNNILNQLEKENVQFIVASGRPYVRLKEDFKDFFKRIDFVSVNGARLMADDKQVGITPIDKQTVLDAINLVDENYDNIVTMVYGANMAYLLSSAPKKDRDFLSYFAKDTELVDDWNDLKDQPYVEITFSCSRDQASVIQEKFNAKYGKKISAFGSADFAVDVNAYGVSKATGLEQLLANFGLTGDDLLAFGDGGNDIPMLKLAKYSYAMDNAVDEVKKHARYIAPKNTENGVFRVIQKYLDENK